MAPAFDLRDKVVLVTGASRGVGRALAVALGARGAKVACAARATDEHRLRLPGTIDETARAVEAAGGEALAVPTDLSRPADVTAMVTTTAEHFGRLDVLVNNAAVTFDGDLTIDPKRYDLIMDINVRAPMVATRDAHRALAAAGEGRVLNVSSFAALSYYPSMMIYGMSKAALEHLSVSCAAQLEADRIAVNCFRIDTAVATEGYMMNAPDADHASWTPPEVAAAGMIWMLDQPVSYTGRVESMLGLARRSGCMPTVAALADRASVAWPVHQPTV